VQTERQRIWKELFVFLDRRRRRQRRLSSCRGRSTSVDENVNTAAFFHRKQIGMLVLQAERTLIDQEISCFTGCLVFMKIWAHPDSFVHALFCHDTIQCLPIHIYVCAKVRSKDLVRTSLSRLYSIVLQVVSKPSSDCLKSWRASKVQQTSTARRARSFSILASPLSSLSSSRLNAAATS
jgi:hypothetical protein